MIAELLPAAFLCGIRASEFRKAVSPLRSRPAVADRLYASGSWARRPSGSAPVFTPHGSTFHRKLNRCT